MDNKTIFALSTVFGKSGVAVFRISGKDALKSIESMTNLSVADIKPRFAYFTKIFSVDKKSIIDNALVLYFKSPNSFNGEDIVEFQVHGSKAVISLMVENLAKITNYRLAEHGEFSKRAFYNGKMDLTQAEGLADLIDAETREQQKYAIMQTDGNLKNLYTSWREKLVKILAHLEAYIDFPDEDIPLNTRDDILNTVLKIQDEIKVHLSNNKNGEKIHDGYKVIIIGRPNSGKSSLVNSIIKREAVIVSDIEGTTRDAIDIYFDLAGYPVIITDTAGLRDKTTDIIEEKGIEIAKKKIKNADLVVALFDATKDNKSVFSNIIKDNENNVIYVANKCDKLTENQIFEMQQGVDATISAKKNIGIDKLLNIVLQKIKADIRSPEGMLITRERYRESLVATLEYLDEFSLDKNIELSAEDIRLAVREIGKITGHVDVEEILDKIFSSFCIGK